MRPLNAVIMRGFIKLILYLAPSTYQMPSAYIIGKELDDMYEELSLKLKTKFGKLTSFSITTDGWTSTTNVGYITYTIHLINSEWAFENYVLQTRPLKVYIYIYILHYNLY